MARDANTNGVSATERTPLLATKDIAPTADPVVAVATTLQASGSNSSRGGALDGTEDEEYDGGSSVEGQDDDDDQGPPLPKWQIFWLCFARMVEPMAFFSIFPYINQMAQRNGNLADTDVGFYSGLIESLFSLTQALVMIFWGKAADSFGRKPVLVLSLIGVSMTTSVFGMARTLWQMILFRSLAGVFAATIVTIRTMLTELSTPRTQAMAFSWFAFSGNLGIFLGPLAGGALADPARQYPGLFGHVQFFLDYPYALSSFVVAGLGFAGAITTALFVEETLPRYDDAPAEGSREEQGEAVTRVTLETDELDGSAGPAMAKAAPTSIRDIFRSPGVPTVLYVYSHISLLAFAYTAVVPVFWFTPVSLGGYGFTPYQISIMMAVNGAAQALWLLLIFPPLQRRRGTGGVLRGCAYAYPFFFAVCPLGNILLRSGGEGDSQQQEHVFWLLAPPLLALGSGVSMCFTAIQLALNDVSPGPRALGTLNSLALTQSSVIRAFAPALFTSLFALGARTQWVWGYAIWVLMVAMGVWFAIVARWVPDGQDIYASRGARRGGGEGRQRGSGTGGRESDGE